MAKHIVKCRICKKEFDTLQLNSSEWVQPTPRFYYHTNCYHDWCDNKNSIKINRDDTFWKESMIDYLYRDIKMSINFAKLENQWESFLKKSFTPKGIYFAVRYFYEILKGNPEKAQGGIGIVSSIYKDSAQYWSELESKKEGTIAAIEKQLKEKSLAPVLTLKKEEKKKVKSKWNLDNI